MPSSAMPARPIRIVILAILASMAMVLAAFVSSPAAHADAVPGTISGNVAANGGAAFAVGSTVQVSLYTSATVSLVGNTTADSNGDWSFSGVADGSYLIEYVESPASGTTEYYNEWWANAGPVQSFFAADPLVVAAADTPGYANVDASLDARPEVTGTVTDIHGAPLEGIGVQVQDGSRIVRSGYTNADGTFHLFTSDPGTYTINFLGGATYFDDWLGESDTQDGSTTVTLSDNGIQSVGTETLAKRPPSSGTLSGTLTAGAGSFTDSDYGVVTVDKVDADGTNPVEFASTYTNSDGTWSLTNLPAGNYTVHFSEVTLAGEPAFRDAWYGGANEATAHIYVVSAIPAPEQYTDVNEVLPAFPYVGGKLLGTGSESAGAAGVQVNLFDASGHNFASGVTDSDGNYGFSIQDADHTTISNFSVQFTTDDNHYLEQWYGNTPTQTGSTALSVSDNHPLNLTTVQLAAASSISGTVTGTNNAPAVGITVIASLADGDGSWAGYATTDSDGKYTIVGLDAGTYDVHFYGSGYLDGYWQDSTDYETQTPLVIGRSAAVTSINARLTLASDLSGVVQAGNGFSTPPLAGIDVMATNNSSQLSYYAGTTDSTGGYDIGGLPYGTYTVTFTADDPTVTNYATRTETNVQVNSPTTGLTVALTRGAVITGSVTSSTNEPTTVILWQGDTLIQATTVSSFSHGVGTYRFQALAAGAYTVEFSPSDGDTYTDVWWNGKAGQASATVVTVTAGATSSAINATITKRVQPASMYIKAKHDYAANVGETLSIAVDKRSGHPGPYVTVPSKVTSSYQWFRMNADTEAITTISKAIKSTYVPTGADAGYEIGVRVTESASGYSPTTFDVIDFNQIYGAKFSKTPKVSVTGTASTGHSLTVKVTGATSPASTVSYFWADNGIHIPDSWTSNGGKSLLLGWDDLGHGNPYDSSAGNNPPSSWLGAKGNVNTPEDANNPAGDPSSHDYPFTLSQLLQPEFNGQRASVYVCFDRDFYDSYCKTITVHVAKDLIKRVIPTISKAGNVWTANAGVWHSSTYVKGTVKLTYQWLRNGVPISGATKSSYTVGSADSGHLVTVRVTGSAKGYTTATIVSLNTALAP